MRIVIFGRKWLAAGTLARLTQLPAVEVVAVRPDISPDRLVAAAVGMEVPRVVLDAVSTCDIGVAACCQRFLPPKVRDRCGLGVLAYHPSLLRVTVGAMRCGGPWPCGCHSGRLSILAGRWRRYRPY